MSATLSLAETSPALAAALPASPVINDLAIRVGTVNGSGSQSANLVLLRALYAMGIPCSGKNVFPSNIEGLPTWFHIRASAKGYVGHRLDPQILVCMNEPTAKDDVLQLKPGSICIYRDDFDVDRSDPRRRPVPRRCRSRSWRSRPIRPTRRTRATATSSARSSTWCTSACWPRSASIEMEAVEAGIRREFPGRKAKAAEINIAAARAGYEWAEENLPDRPALSRRADGLDHRARS